MSGRIHSPERRAGRAARPDCHDEWKKDVRTSDREPTGTGRADVTNPQERGSENDRESGESRVGRERGGSAGRIVPGNRVSSNGGKLPPWCGTECSWGERKTYAAILGATDRTALSAPHRKEQDGYFRAATEAYPNGLISVFSSDAGAPPGPISRLVGAMDAVTCVRHPSL